MAKRDRDTLIWKDPFYRGLPPLYKCLWDFINDDCDNSGVWGCDFKVAGMVIGKRIDKEKAVQLFGSRIEASEDGSKWWIKTFIPDKLGFEIENLNPAHKFQKSILDLLIKHKVKSFRVFADTLQSVKERVREEREGEGQGVSGDFTLQTTIEPFEQKFREAFTELTLERFRMQFKWVNLERELSTFKLKCDNDPGTYHHRDPATLRTNFLYQLKQVKPEKKNGVEKVIDDSRKVANLIEAKYGHSQAG